MSVAGDKKELHKSMIAHGLHVATHEQEARDFGMEPEKKLQ